MGFMSWLTKGMGFESDETYSPEEKQKLYEEKLRQKEEKRQRKLEKKNKKVNTTTTSSAPRENGYQSGGFGGDNQSASVRTYADNPDQYNTLKYDKPMNDYGVGGTNVGGYGTKNVVFVNPMTIDDGRIVIGYLKDGESVMLNLNRMNNQGDAQRLLDCIFGAVIALNCNLRRVDANIFLITPEGFNIKVPDSQN